MLDDESGKDRSLNKDKLKEESKVNNVYKRSDVFLIVDAD